MSADWQFAHRGFVWQELMTGTEGARDFCQQVTGLTADPGPYQRLAGGAGETWADGQPAWFPPHTQ